METAGKEGSRSVLLLSDGKNTNDTELEEATRAIKQSKVKVDVVALAQGSKGAPYLEEIARAGGGQQIPADDPEALVELFESEAQTLASQILVTIPNTEELQGREGSLEVTFLVDGQAVTDSTFVTFPASEGGVGGAEAISDLEAVEPGLLVPTELMLGGLAALVLGLLAVVVVFARMPAT